MSEFSDAVEDAFRESGDVFGLIDATLPSSVIGREVILHGVLDQQQQDRSLVKGGEKPFRTCTYMVSLDQFDDFPDDQGLQDLLCNVVLSLDGIQMRIERVLVDEMNVTLMLDDKDR